MQQALFLQKCLIFKSGLSHYSFRSQSISSKSGLIQYAQKQFVKFKNQNDYQNIQRSKFRRSEFQYLAQDLNKLGHASPFSPFQRSLYHSDNQSSYSHNSQSSVHSNRNIQELDPTHQYENKEIAEKYAKWSENDKLTHKLLVPTVQSYFKDLNQESVLDVGCGSGLWTRALWQLTHGAVAGIDSSSSMIEIGTMLSPPEMNLYFFQENIAKLSPLNHCRDHKFDIVTAMFVLDQAESIEKMRVMIENMKSFLKPDGQLFGIVNLPSNQGKPEIDYLSKYGIKFSILPSQSIQDGSKYLTSLKSQQDTINTMTINWDKSTYLKELRRAGFKQILEIEPEVSDDDSHKFKDYIDQQWSFMFAAKL